MMVGVGNDDDDNDNILGRGGEHAQRALRRRQHRCWVLSLRAGSPLAVGFCGRRAGRTEKSSCHCMNWTMHAYTKKKGNAFSWCNVISYCDRRRRIPGLFSLPVFITGITTVKTVVYGVTADAVFTIVPALFHWAVLVVWVTIFSNAATLLIGAGSLAVALFGWRVFVAVITVLFNWWFAAGHFSWPDIFQFHVFFFVL